MNSPYLKPRALPPPSRLRQNINHARGSSTPGNSGMDPARFDNFYPRPNIALWFALCPEQKWTSEAYDKDAGMVLEHKDALFYAYTNHRVNMNNQTFVCSAGARKDKPCWGCGVRNYFYDRQRAKEEATGVRVKGEAPINAPQQYAFAGVLLEHVGKVQAVDASGRPKLNRENKPYYRNVPLSLMANKEEAKRMFTSGETTFGLGMHWSVGITHLNTIGEIDKELTNYCKHCASKLNAVQVACPKCLSEEYTPTWVALNNEPAEGTALTEVREEKIKCSCGYHGVMVPLIECAGGCENPEAGQLTEFAIKLYTTKSSDTKTDLRWSEIKPIKHFLDKHAHITGLLENPVKLDAIFAPTPLARQTRPVPESLRHDGVTPDPRRRRDEGEAQPHSQPYTLGGGQEDAGEPEDSTGRVGISDGPSSPWEA